MKLTLDHNCKNLKLLRSCLIFMLGTAQIMAQSFDRVTDFDLQSELINSNGVAVADYDLDGDLDVFVVASEKFDKDNPMTWSRLLRNEGGQEFVDVTIASNLINWEAETRDGTMGSKMGASWGDYDNDGYPDIFISNYGLDELWHNQGDGTFTNVTETAKVAGCLFCYSSNAVWWDYDQDGDLDLYVSDWLKENRFYRNESNGLFTDISEITGLNDRGHTFSSLPIDLNKDGLLDLYVVNDIGENRFYSNKGNDQFTDITEQVGLANNGNGMGVAVCDYGNDGLFDIYVTNIYEYVPNPFFVNNGQGAFADQSYELGIDNTGWGWGARFFDADHDMDEDLYVVNGFSSLIAEEDKNRFFLNHGHGFTDVSENLSLNSPQWGMGLEVFDYDLDGDLDMLVGNRNAPLDLYRNNAVGTIDPGNWIKIQLQGTNSNPQGWGSIVKITCDGVDFHRYHSGVNLFGQSILPLHFGLQAHQQVDKIQVSWPSGLTEEFGVMQSNQLLNLIEGTGETVAEDIVLYISNEMHGGFNLFPNPFHDRLWLRSTSTTPLEIEFRLVDVWGREVSRETVFVGGNRSVMDLPLKATDSPPGLYLYQVVGKGILENGKIFKR